jgi:sortase A
MGIAGHRDGFFRGLKDVVLGDALELETTSGTQTYIIDSIKLVTPDDVSVLRNEPTSALTLVTCYPFYFVGSAPQRYIVHASARGEPKTRNEPPKASLQATASRTKERTQ